jgi:hypothetical protein
MKLVELIEGAVELRWSWLPYWLGANQRLRAELEVELRDVALINGLTTSAEDLSALSRVACRRIQVRFPGLVGLEQALLALSSITETSNTF